MRSLGSKTRPPAGKDALLVSTVVLDQIAYFKRLVPRSRAGECWVRCEKGKVRCRRSSRSRTRLGTSAVKAGDSKSRCNVFLISR